MECVSSKIKDAKNIYYAFALTAFVETVEKRASYINNTDADLGAWRVKIKVT